MGAAEYLKESGAVSLVCGYGDPRPRATQPKQQQAGGLMGLVGG